MSRRDRLACLLLGLGSLVAFVPAGGGEGDASAQGRSPTVAATAPAGPALPAPQWVSGSDARGKASLVWIHSPAFVAVRVFRRDEGSTAFVPLGETSENTWLDERVQPGRTYRYQLAGVGPDGSQGRLSAELAVRIGTVSMLPAAAPVWDGYLLLADGVGLKWSARGDGDVLAWNVYRKSPPGTEFELIASTRGTSYHDTGLEPDRLYVYALTALDPAFRETPLSQELPVRFTRPQAPAVPRQPAVWKVRRTRLVAVVTGGKELSFERPSDVAVGASSGTVYVADSGRNLVFVFSPLGVFQRTVGAGAAGQSGFGNLLGVATDREENLYAVDARAGAVQVFSPQGLVGRRVELSRRKERTTGLIDAAVGPDGRVYVVDNYNNQVEISGREGGSSFGQRGSAPGDFSAPTFCDVDAAGSLFVADCLNGRVQVFTESGKFVRAFGRAERGPGGLARPKGVAVSPGGEIYVADSWLNTVQVFDAVGRFVALLADEAGRPLDLGSPNGVALGPGNRVYVAERLAARLQIRELIDVP